MLRSHLCKTDFHVASTNSYLLSLLEKNRGNKIGERIVKMTMLPVWPQDWWLPRCQRIDYQPWITQSSCSWRLHSADLFWICHSCHLLTSHSAALQGTPGTWLSNADLIRLQLKLSINNRDVMQSDLGAAPVPINAINSVLLHSRWWQ